MTQKIRLISPSGLASIEWVQHSSNFPVVETKYDRDDIHRDEWAKRCSRRVSKCEGFETKKRLMSEGWTIG